MLENKIVNNPFGKPVRPMEVLQNTSRATLEEMLDPSTRKIVVRQGQPWHCPLSGGVSVSPSNKPVGTDAASNTEQQRGKPHHLWSLNHRRLAQQLIDHGYGILDVAMASFDYFVSEELPHTRLLPVQSAAAYHEPLRKCDLLCGCSKEPKEDDVVCRSNFVFLASLALRRSKSRARCASPSAFALLLLNAPC